MYLLHLCIHVQSPSPHLNYVELVSTILSDALVEAVISDVLVGTILSDALVSTILSDGLVVSGSRHIVCACRDDPI